jgi:N-acetylmuramoyl-L-alanine amidase
MYLTKVMGKTRGMTGTDELGAGIRNDLGILKINNIPGCLVECGFYDSGDLAKLEEGTEIAHAICNGIVYWCNHYSNKQ